MTSFHIVFCSWSRFFHNRCLLTTNRDFAGWIEQFGWTAGIECLENARREFRDDLLKRAIEQLATNVAAMTVKGGYDVDRFGLRYVIAIGIGLATRFS